MDATQAANLIDSLLIFGAFFAAVAGFVAGLLMARGLDI